MTYTIKPVYKKLREMGFKKNHIEAYLPDWWDDSIATSESGFQQSLWLISNTFNIDFKSLNDSLNTKDIPDYRNVYNYKFKHSSNQSQDKLQPAVSVALLASRLTLSAYDKPLQNISSLTGESIRNTLLSKGNDWIDFSVLVNYCWSIGIPVIYIKQIPSPKMHGLALQKNNRPIIVLTKNDSYGHLVFDLAHELGHIILGHVEDNGMMIDVKIDDKQTETIEVEATKFALEVLTGKNNAKFGIKEKVSPKRLAELVLSTAKQSQIDPLHIILNYGYSTKQFAFSKQVLNIIVRKLDIKETDQEIAQKSYLNNVDVDSMLDDEVIKRIIGV